MSLLFSLIATFIFPVKVVFSFRHMLWKSIYTFSTRPKKNSGISVNSSNATKNSPRNVPKNEEINSRKCLGRKNWFLLIFLLCFSLFLDTHGNSQELHLALHAEITPGSHGELYVMLGPNPVSYMQSKHFTRLSLWPLDRISWTW